MSDVLEAVDAQGYLHAIASTDRHGGVPGYVCTCGTWVKRAEWWKHLDELGPTTPPPADPTLRGRVATAARVVAARHDTYATNDEGWTVCACGAPFPGPEDWGDHYADAVLEAALNEITTNNLTQGAARP